MLETSAAQSAGLHISTLHAQHGSVLKEPFQRVPAPWASFEIHLIPPPPRNGPIHLNFLIAFLWRKSGSNRIVLAEYLRVYLARRTRAPSLQIELNRRKGEKRTPVVFISL